jgi:5-methylcytosine-specific restriction endonuclease McrA
MAMGRECWAHTHREDVPLELHHVWPKGQGGPDVKANRVVICSNAHSAAHDLLAKMLKEHTTALPWSVKRRYGRKVRRLAEVGYAAITTKVVQTL